MQFLEKTEIMCYIFPIAGSSAGLFRTVEETEEGMRVAVERQCGSGKDFFIWILCNPLKSPDSAKGIQGNPSLFPWISLDFLGFIWRPNPVRGSVWLSWKRRLWQIGRTLPSLRDSAAS
jgi:hypothetical protein